MKQLNWLLALLIMSFLLVVGFLSVKKLNTGRKNLESIYIDSPSLYRSCIDYLNNPFLRSNLRKSGLLKNTKPLIIYYKVKTLYYAPTENFNNEYKNIAQELTKDCMLIKQAYEVCSEICKNSETTDACFLNFLKKANSKDKETNKYFWDLLINEEQNNLDLYISQACKMVYER